MLAIHATHAAEVNFSAAHDFFSESFAGVLLNQIARFCVPVFVMLSGYGLTKKYGNVLPEEINISWSMDFYRKRFLKIGIPFFFWTVTLLILLNRFSFSENYFDLILQNTLILLKYLFIKGADYHFYFFTIILECYLLYPLLLKFRGNILFSGIIFVHLIYIYPATISSYTGISLIHFPSSFIVSWLVYFYIGILSADSRIEKKIKSIPVPAAVLMYVPALMYVLYEYVSRSLKEGNPDYFNHFNRLSVFLYAVSFWILFIRMDLLIEASMKFFNSGKIVGYLAGLSFGVYIYHTMLLRFLNYLFPGESLIIIPLLVMQSFLLMIFLDRVVKGNMLRIVTGLPEESPDIKFNLLTRKYVQR